MKDQKQMFLPMKSLNLVWVMDFGCCYHMSSDKSLFNTYDAVEGGEVVTASRHHCRIAGVGTVRIRMYDGRVRKLTEVRHVPDIHKNLISLGVLTDKGYRCILDRTKMKVKMRDRTVI